MEPRLIPINAWIALTSGRGGWPRPLGEQGLVATWFEVPVKTPKSSVVVDALGVNESKGLIVAVEAKSGANIERGQAVRYGAMRPVDVRRVVSLDLPGSEHLEVMYACIAKDYPRIQKGLDEAALKAAVLTVGTDRCVLRVPSGSRLIPFDVRVPGPIPPRLMPFDELSPDDVLLDVMAAEVIAAMRRGDMQVPVASLIERLPFVANLGRKSKSRLAARMTDVLGRAAATRFAGDFVVQPSAGNIQGTQGGVVRFSKRPIDSDPRGETQGWQRLQRRASGQARTKRNKQVKGQLSLDALATEADKGDV